MAKHAGGDVTLQVDIDGSGAGSAISVGQIVDISGPGLSRDTIETTSRDSTNDWREYIKGLKDAGEISFDIVFDPVLASHAKSTGLLQDLWDDSTIASWIVTFPDPTPTTWTMDGILTKFEVKAPLDDKLSADVTIKVSGEPVIA